MVGERSMGKAARETGGRWPCSCCGKVVWRARTGRRTGGLEWRRPALGCGAVELCGAPQQEAAVEHRRRNGGRVALAIAVQTLHSIPHPEEAGDTRAGYAVPGLLQATGAKHNLETERRGAGGRGGYSLRWE